MSVSGRQMHAGLEELGTGSIPPAVFRSSGNLILNGRKVVEMFGVKILNLE